MLSEGKEECRVGSVVGCCEWERRENIGQDGK